MYSIANKANRANRSVEEAIAAALHAAWPPASPYLNPVELDKQVQTMEALQLTALKELLLTFWCQIPQHTFRI